MLILMRHIIENYSGLLMFYKLGMIGARLRAKIFFFVRLDVKLSPNWGDNV